MPQKIKGKTQKTDPPPSPATTLSLSLLCATHVSVCVSNEDRLPLFIFFHSLNIRLSYVGSSNPNSVM